MSSEKTTEALLEAIKGKLVVSVQAYPGEPLRDPQVMALMSYACELGGAAAIRCQGLADIMAIKEKVEIPVIGLWKDGHEGVFITPTYRHALACAMAGSDIVALDATDRPRPDGSKFEDIVKKLHDQDIVTMADCSSIEDIRRGFSAGCAICGTTLAHKGSAIEQAAEQGPNLDLIRQAAKEFPGKAIICEGSVHSPKDAKEALEAGAWAVVVGTAITHPTSLTSWFCQAMESARPV